MYCPNCKAQLNMSLDLDEVDEVNNSEAVIVWMCPECHELFSVLVAQEDLTQARP